MGLIETIKKYKPIVGMAAIQAPAVAMPFAVQCAMDKGLGDLVASGIFLAGMTLLPVGWAYATITATKIRMKTYYNKNG